MPRADNRGDGTAWTPGPWEVSRDEYGDLFIKAPSSELPEHCVCNMGLVSDAAFEHDARLIAAAPELYRELDELVEWLHNNQRCVEGMFSMDDLLEGPRATLAKARGETA